MQKKQSGFTLIEMMIVVVIVAILAAFAFPAYNDYIRKSRRADGMNYLLELQTLQEKHRASATTYTNSVTTAPPNGLGKSTLSPNGNHYSVAITNNSATGYVLTATAQGTQAQDKGRDGSTCNSLILTVNATNPRGVKTSSTSNQCWN